MIDVRTIAYQILLRVILRRKEQQLAPIKTFMLEFLPFQRMPGDNPIDSRNSVQATDCSISVKIDRPEVREEEWLSWIDVMF